MIDFNERFSFNRDQWQWLLHDYGNSRTTKTGKPVSGETTYHSTLEHLTDTIVDRSLVDVSSLSEMTDRLADLKQDMYLAVGGVSIDAEKKEMAQAMEGTVNQTTTCTINEMLELTPITLTEANEYVTQHHRHHKPVVGHKFSIAVSDGDTVRGVDTPLITHLHSHIHRHIHSTQGQSM